MRLGLKFTIPLKKSRGPVRKYLILECDTCHIRFCKLWHKKTATQKFHFHAMTCKVPAYRVGGVAYDVDAVKARLEKAADTLEAEYGVRKLSHVPEFIERGKQTCLDKYGVTCVLNRPENVPKRIKSYVEHFGVQNPMQNLDVNRQRLDTMLLKYGVEYPLQVSEFKAKMHSTMIERFGVEHALQSPQIMNEIDWIAAGVKRHETMKSSGGYVKRSSKDEDVCYELLCERFGIENVERQVFMNKRWPIDFYVKNIDAFVQLDGVYWHGLDRPVEVIAEHRTKRDATIHARLYADQRQNDWFHERQLRLVRFTDKDLKSDPSSCILKVVRSCQDSS